MDKVIRGSTIVADEWTLVRLPVRDEPVKKQAGKAVLFKLTGEQAATEEEVAAVGGAERSSNRMGVTVVELNEEQRRALDLPFGVAVKEVQGGPAALIGLRPGDVITHLNNRAIDSAKTFTQIAQALPTNRSVSMRVLRQGRASFITFRLAE